MIAAGWFIKLRKEGEKRWNFLTPSGRETHLRIHASLFGSEEDATIRRDLLAADNPEFEFKVVSRYR